MMSAETSVWKKFSSPALCLSEESEKAGAPLRFWWRCFWDSASNCSGTPWAKSQKLLIFSFRRSPISIKFFMKCALSISSLWISNRIFTQKARFLFNLCWAWTVLERELKNHSGFWERLIHQTHGKPYTRNREEQDERSQREEKIQNVFWIQTNQENWKTWQIKWVMIISYPWIQMGSFYLFKFPRKSSKISLTRGRFHHQKKSFSALFYSWMLIDLFESLSMEALCCFRSFSGVRLIWDEPSCKKMSNLLQQFLKDHRSSLFFWRFSTFVARGSSWGICFPSDSSHLTRIIIRFQMDGLSQIRGLEFNLSENWKRKKDHTRQILFSLFFLFSMNALIQFFLQLRTLQGIFILKAKKVEWDDGVRYFFSLWNATFPLLLSNYSRTRTLNLKNSPQVPNPNPTHPQKLFSAIEIIFLGRFFKVLFWKLRNIWNQKCRILWEFFESGFGIISQSEKYLSRYFEKKSLPNHLSVGLLW